ncbi:MAG: GNAT family N-acetyltransferase [Clostridia bacterium]|nr:GNAT family N-acetyltransferase [Clostridia bacterium]
MTEKLKILTEDEELEEFVFDGGSDIAVPVTLDESDGVVTLTVYSRYMREAEEFAGKYGGDPFSKEALAYLDGVFSPLMEKAGFRFECEYDQTVLNFASDVEVPVTDCGADIVFADTNEKLNELYLSTTRDIEIDDDDPCDVVFAAVKDGAALSVASVNDYSDNGSVEINVETEKNSRGKGYATAAVSSLVNYLVSLGETVSYRCRKSNAASRRVAEKAGLKYKGKTFFYVCYKK